MFWRILKKDLKRKKTMNIILLLFVILCSMLAAASVNNIVAVTGGIEHFMDISDAPDVMISMSFDQELDQTLRKLPEAENVKVEEIFFLTADHFKLNGEKHKDLINGTGLYSDREFGCRYFDSDDQEITGVPEGGFYCTKNFLQGAPFEKGGILTVTIGEESFDLRFEGIYKTVSQDTNNASSPYLMLNSADWDELNSSLEGSAFMKEKTLYVKTNDTDAVIAAAGDTEGISVYTKDHLKSYFMILSIPLYTFSSKFTNLLNSTGSAKKFL